MNSAALAPAPSTRGIRRWTLPGRMLRRISAGVARGRSHFLEDLDPREVHRLQQEADSLRTENFRTVAVGRLI
ncbi:hypothetical protein ACFPER_07205 [Agromyces aurantiacus]|uniref:DUF1127 domain-containing protein n=1 Tax=Agromyces aurantiacus TaxID=165814 RepID=A0ABV9R5F7_9MICO|nr:hypothetical protein [Agromyces aurantiacus]MBM7503253.1 hypothetical protein [Agromyces aurantiacus]